MQPAMQRWTWLALILLIALPLLPPLLTSAPTHSADGRLHLYRAVQLDATLRGGVLFTRWQPDLAYGYGFPLFNFYAPLSPYLTELFHLFGLPFVPALHAALITSLLIAGLGAALLTHTITHNPYAALLSAVTMMSSPYLLFDLLHRSNLAESLAFGLLPFVLWTLVRLETHTRPRDIALAALACATLILTHNLFSLLFFPTAALFLLLVWFQGDRSPAHLLRWSIAALLALALSAFFWLPMIAEQNWVQTARLFAPGDLDFRHNFPSLWEDLLALPFPVDPLQMNTEIPIAIGWPQLLLALLGAIGWWHPRSPIQRRFVRAALPVILLLIFLMLPISLPIWEHISFMRFIQFPWRLLGPFTLWLALLASGVAYIRLLPVPSRASLLLAGALAFSIGMAMSWTYPAYLPPPDHPLTPADIHTYEHNSGAVGTTSAADYLPIWVDEAPQGSPLEPMYLAGATIERLDPTALPPGAQINQATYGINHAEIDLCTPVPFEATYLTFFFPGWRAWIDGEPIEIGPAPHTGLIRFDVPEGCHIVTIRFTDSTPARRWGNTISLIGLTALISLLFLPQKHSPTHEPTPTSSIAILPALVLTSIALTFIRVASATDLLPLPIYRTRFVNGQIEGVQNPLQLNFADQITLLGYDLSSPTPTAGEKVELSLYWTPRTQLNTDYSVSVKLVDKEGHLYAQSDHQHPGGWTPTSRWEIGKYVRDHHNLPIPTSTPPGTYLILVTLYEPTTLAPLDIFDAQNRPTGTDLRIEIAVLPPTKPHDSQDEITLPTPINAPIGPLTLLGSDPLPGEKSVGETLVLGLYLQIDQPISAEDDRVQLTIGDPQDPLLTLEAPLAGTAQAPQPWDPGLILHSFFSLHLRADLPAGQWPLSLTWPPTGETVPIGTLAIRTPERLLQPPPIANPIEVHIEPIATLVGYTLSPNPASPGETLTVTLTWRCDALTDRSDKVFVHLLAPDGTIHSQQDTIPVQGTRPTTGWLPGEYLIDTYHLPISPNAPSGTYHIAIGMYDPNTNIRRPLYDHAGNRIPDDRYIFPEEVHIP